LNHAGSSATLLPTDTNNQHEKDIWHWWCWHKIFSTRGIMETYIMYSMWNTYSSWVHVFARSLPSTHM
jgi:hypothetical protein